MVGREHCFSPLRPVSWRSRARTSSTRSTTGAVTSPAQYGVGQETLHFVDNSRGTPANGTAPALPYRKLTTSVLYPSTVSPTKNPVANAAPAIAGKPFPFILFVQRTRFRRLHLRPTARTVGRTALRRGRADLSAVQHCRNPRRHGQGPGQPAGRHVIRPHPSLHPHPVVRKSTLGHDRSQENCGREPL